VICMQPSQRLVVSEIVHASLCECECYTTLHVSHGVKVSSNESRFVTGQPCNAILATPVYRCHRNLGTKKPFQWCKRA